jgi:hypothetical protein
LPLDEGATEAGAADVAGDGAVPDEAAGAFVAPPPLGVQATSVATSRARVPARSRTGKFDISAHTRVRIGRFCGSDDGPDDGPDEMRVDRDRLPA